MTIYSFQILPSDIGLPSSFDNLGSIVGALLPVIVSGTGLLMFAYLLFGGVKYITASGDSKQTQEATKTITNAITGLVIVFVAFWIVRILETVLGINITK